VIVVVAVAGVVVFMHGRGGQPPAVQAARLWTMPGAGFSPKVSVGQQAIYETTGNLVLAHDPDTGAVRWRADLFPLVVLRAVELDRDLLVVSGLKSPSPKALPVDTSELLDPASGRVIATVAGDVSGRVAGQPWVLSVASDVSATCRCITVYAVDVSTGRQVWSQQLPDTQHLVGDVENAPGWIGDYSDDGQVRQRDLATGAVAGRFTLPAAARSAGAQSSSWIVESAHSSVYVTADQNNQVVVSGIDPSTDSVQWTRSVPAPLAAHGAMSVTASRCGRLVCLRLANEIVLVDPATGNLTTLAGVNSVVTIGTIWAALYPPAGSDVGAVSFLDPHTFAPGPRIDNLQAQALTTAAVIGLRPVRSSPTQLDTLVIEAHPDGTQTTLAQLAGSDWSCDASGLRVACAEVKPATLEVFSG
jgi:hypothetical protein